MRPSFRPQVLLVLAVAWCSPETIAEAGAAHAALPAQDPPRERDADTLPQEAGVYGTVRPEVGDVVLADSLVHEDREGRAQHGLCAVAGSPGRGFAGVWRDSRDGNAGLYFGRLDGAGVAPLSESPLYPQGSSSRELEPAIALAPGGHGAFVWLSSGVPASGLKLRTFDAEGRIAPPVTPLGAAAAAGRDATGEARRPGGGPRQPAIALHDDWGAVAWGDGGALFVQRFDGAGALLGAAEQVALPERALAGPHRLCAVGAGAEARIACAWTTREGYDAALLGRAGFERLTGGSGVLERLVPAPDGAPTAWVLAQGSAGRRLVELATTAGVAGAPGLDLGFSARDACDVAVRSGPGGREFLFAVQRASGAVELHALDPRAADPQPRKLADVDLGGTSASDLRLAGAGTAALVAWTGSVARQTDVWYATLDAEGALSPARRWNTDERSAPQNHGRIASRGGDRAVVAWLDGRTGKDRLFARWLAADGSFLGEEFAIVAQDSGAALAGDPVEPSLALGRDGGFLLAWKQLEKRSYRLLARAFDASGAPQSGLLELDAGEDDPPLFKADVDVTPFGAGYAVAYGRQGRGAFVRALRAGGRGVGEPVQVFEHPLCQRLALAELDGGGLAVAWDITVPGAENRAVRGRVLESRLEQSFPVFEPPLSIFGDDWDPVLAAAPGGGFALVHCGGKQHSRDVFLRFFDASGALASPLVPISARMNEQDYPAVTRLADGSLCVAFEDDLSAYDHVYVRRVAPGGEAGSPPVLGPIRTLNERASVFNENRVMPRVAALAGGGFAAVWVDARRSQGTDVRVKIVGPRFDTATR